MATSYVNGNGKRSVRNRRDKRSTLLGNLTDELRLALANDIRGKMLQKAAARHMGVPLDTLKSFLTSVYVNAPREKFLNAVINCKFTSELTRTRAKMILARVSGEYSDLLDRPSSPQG